MNPLYAQMLAAQDPQQAMAQQMGAYRPAQLQQLGGQSQIGMSIGQMGQALMGRKMKDAQQVDDLQSDGMAAT